MSISVSNGKTTVPDEEATEYMLANTTEEERLQELTEWFFSGNWLHYETCARCENVGCADCRKELKSWDG